MHEKTMKSTSGGHVLLALLAPFAFGIVLFVLTVRDGDVLMITTSILLELAVVVLLFGLFMVNPNEARVLQLVGRYVGPVRNLSTSVRHPGS